MIQKSFDLFGKVDVVAGAISLPPRLQKRFWEKIMGNNKKNAENANVSSGMN